MNIGFTIGKFAPLHKGHQYLIEKGLKEMDVFYVVIYETDVIKHSLNERANWLKNMYPTLKIIYAINPPKQYGLDEDSIKIQTDYLKEIMANIPVTHFYSSEAYGKFVARDFNILEVLVDKKRENYNISASKIREDIEKHKKYIEPRIYQEIKEKKMIDFQKAKEEFEKYLEKYVLEDGNVRLKVIHTYGVVKCSEYIARSLGLEEEQIELAKLIALLHDIGRFEQITTTKSWEDDKGLDHAMYGVQLLFENGMIRRFIKDNKYNEIIKKAIQNHSLLNIEDGLNDEELIYAKIIRDADKLDNFRVKEEESLEYIITYSLEKIEEQEISKEVYESFEKNECVKIEDRKTALDVWVCVLAFIFDLNFDVSVAYVKENDYINKLINRIEYKNEDTKKKMEKIRRIALEYLEKRA